MLILVVDDEESICELLTEILSEQYEVIKAFDGKQALELVRLRKPDLIVSDIMMPNMSGIELLETLRAEEATAHLPVILLSAVPPSSKLTQQADGFVKKPFEIEILEKLVADIADKPPSDSATLEQPNKISNSNPTPPQNNLYPPAQTPFSIKDWERREYKSS